MDNKKKINSKINVSDVNEVVGLSKKILHLVYIMMIIGIAFLGTLMYLRWKNETASWIGLISYAGVLIALSDLFYECISKYKNRVGIGLFVLISTVVGIILMIILANIFDTNIFCIFLDNIFEYA